jgi:hypothetical protein
MCLLVVGAAVRPSCGVLLDVAKEFVHHHGHGTLGRKECCQE